MAEGRGHKSSSLMTDRTVFVRRDVIRRWNLTPRRSSVMARRTVVYDTRMVVFGASKTRTRRMTGAAILAQRIGVRRRRIVDDTGRNRAVVTRCTSLRCQVDLGVIEYGVGETTAGRVADPAVVRGERMRRRGIVQLTAGAGYGRTVEVAGITAYRSNGKAAVVDGMLSKGRRGVTVQAIGDGVRVRAALTRVRGHTERTRGDIVCPTIVARGTVARDPGMRQR